MSFQFQFQFQFKQKKKKAEKKIAFLRIITPKDKTRDKLTSSTGISHTIYHDDGTTTTTTDVGVGKIPHKARTSNWDGTNMDPCSVKRHYAGLKRAGFVNNAHAKGIF